MNRFIFWALTALSFSACTDGGDSHTDDTGTHTDTDNPSEMARLTVNVTRLGDPEPCFVRLDGETIGPSGEELEVSPGSYQLTVGSDEMTADSLPIHRDAENVAWVAVPSDVALAASSPQTETVELNRYFSAPFNCVAETYEYDPSNEVGDFKGDLYDTSHYDEFMLTVEEGDLAVTPPEFSIGGNLRIHGSSFTWEPDSCSTEECFMMDHGTSGQIWIADNGDTAFRGVFVNTWLEGVTDVTCEEE